MQKFKLENLCGRNKQSTLNIASITSGNEKVASVNFFKDSVIRITIKNHVLGALIDSGSENCCVQYKILQKVFPAFHK